MLSVSVIVVSYNTREKLRRCLGCIEPEHEVIVVDNGSVDGSPEMVRRDFPQVTLVAAGENLGFGIANNRGVKLATRELLLFLNSDCYAEPGSISRLARAFADPEVSGAGGRLLNPDGSLQNSTAEPMTLKAVLWEQTFLEKLFPIYWTTKRLYREAVWEWEGELAERASAKDEIIHDFDVLKSTYQIMGACLMCRREGFPGFDSRFFLYMEDTMLCDALNDRGRMVWNFQAPFIHELGASSSKEWWRGVARYNAGKELYFDITGGPEAARTCRNLNRMGALLRMILKPHRAGGFWQIFKAPPVQVQTLAR